MATTSPKEDAFVVSWRGLERDILEGNNVNGERLTQRKGMKSDLLMDGGTEYVDLPPVTC